ncbi:unnamed protein product [Brassica oleracea]
MTIDPVNFNNFRNPKKLNLCFILCSINVQDERFPRTSSCSVQIETSQRKQVRQTKPCSKAPPTKKISLFDLKDNVFVILTGLLFDNCILNNKETVMCSVYFYFLMWGFYDLSNQVGGSE